MPSRGKFHTIWRFLRPAAALFAAALVCSMLNTTFNALTPQIIRTTVDSIIGAKPFQHVPRALVEWLTSLPFHRALMLAAAAVLVVSALSALFTFLSRVGTARCSERFVKGIRDTLYSHIQKLPFAWHTAHQTGEIIQRCTSDVEVIRRFVTGQCLEAVRIAFLILVSFTAMFLMDWRITLVAGAFLPLIFAYSFYYYSHIGRRFRVADEAEGALTADVQENLTSVRVVRAFGREHYEVEKFDRLNEHYSQLWIKLGELMSVFRGGNDLVCGTQILTVILMGIYATVGGRITAGTYIAFLTYNNSMIWPVRNLARILSDMSKAGVSIDRVSEILDAEEEQAPAQPREPDWAGDIVFDHVNFGYDNAEPVLKDVSFTIPAGKSFAILGGTGSGKSTIAALLTRLYDLEDDQGRITIGGVDIRDIPQEELRRGVGLVLQEPFLYSRTVEENIKAARPDADREEVRRTARIASVDQALAEMALGYDTVVGERGVTLSGGQKQRVAIARTLLRQTPVLLLDDSLSAVDTETDERIRSALLAEAAGVTLILISHRVTTLMACDHILVLEDGRVVQEGTHQELIGREGPYRRVYDIQMSQDDRRLLEGGDGE